VRAHALPFHATGDEGRHGKDRGLGVGGEDEIGCCGGMEAGRNGVEHQRFAWMGVGFGSVYETVNLRVGR
jgi:hypothetical protein